MSARAEVAKKLEIVGDDSVPAVARTEALEGLDGLVEDRPELVAEVFRRLRATARQDRFDTLTDPDDPEYWLCRNIGTAIGELDGLSEAQVNTLLADRLGTRWSVRFAASQALRTLADRRVLARDTYLRFLDVYRADLRVWREAFSHEKLPPGTDGADILDVHLPAMHEMVFALELLDHPALATDFANDLAAARAALTGGFDDYWRDMVQRIIAIILGHMGEAGQRALAAHAPPTARAPKASAGRAKATSTKRVTTPSTKGKAVAKAGAAITKKAAPRTRSGSTKARAGAEPRAGSRGASGKR